MRVETQDAYRWYVDDDGARYPSVTTVLGQMYRKIEWGWNEAQWMSDGSRRFYLRRGQLVHKAVYLFASGQGVKPSSVDPLIAPHLAQFENFALRCRVEFRGAELLVVSQRYGFAGREDLDLVLGSGRKRKTTTLDVKTGQHDRLVGPQTFAYWLAHGETYGEWNNQRAVLYLRDGAPHDWELRILRNPYDRSHFKRALDAFNSARELGCLDRWTNPELFDMNLDKKERLEWNEIPTTPQP